MQRIAHIRNNQIVNVSLAQGDAPLAAGTMLEANALAAGYEWATSAATETLPDAENYQVRAWMIRGGMDPDLVPQIIAKVVPEGVGRKEALMRWDYAVRVPRSFPLVDVIGSQMGLTPQQIDAAWPNILSL